MRDDVPPRDWRGERWFYTGMAVAILAAAAAGFVPGLLDGDARRGPVTPLVAVHALAVTAWLCLFLAQTTLIAARRTRLHRQLGVAGGVIAAFVVVSSYLTTVAMARRGYRLAEGFDTTDMARHLILPFGDLLTFTLATAAALWFRRNGAVHKRLMMLGSVGGFVPASLAHFIRHFHLPLPALLVPLIALLFAPAVHERLFDRTHASRLPVWSGWGSDLDRARAHGHRPERGLAEYRGLVGRLDHLHPFHQQALRGNPPSRQCPVALPQAWASSTRRCDVPLLGSPAPRG